MMGCMHTLLSGYGTWLEMSSTAVLLIQDGVRIIFDTGAVAERGNLLKALAQLNLYPEDIDIVANTHMHMDHCHNNLLFTKAKWYCSDGDYDNLYHLVLALNKPGVDLKCIANEYLALMDGMPKTLFEKVKRFLVSDAIPEKIINTRRIGQKDLNQLGIQVIATPGHTDGHISFVCYDLMKENKAIIAGDVIISRDHFQPGRRCLFTKDINRAERSKQRLSILGGWCLPGHGKAFYIPEKRMMEVYPSQIP